MRAAAPSTPTQVLPLRQPTQPGSSVVQPVRQQYLELRATVHKKLLNRAAEPYPIPPSQIETALGHPVSQIFLSDYKTVSTALNSGVPLATAGNSELASQFDSFARRLLDPNAVDEQPQVKRGPLPLGLQRLASIW